MFRLFIILQNKNSSLDLVLSDSELEEVYQSFFHLGKALFIFANQQEVVNDQKTS